MVDKVKKSPLPSRESQSVLLARPFLRLPVEPRGSIYHLAEFGHWKPYLSEYGHDRLKNACNPAQTVLLATSKQARSESRTSHCACNTFHVTIWGLEHLLEHHGDGLGLF